MRDYIYYTGDSRPSRAPQGIYMFSLDMHGDILYTRYIQEIYRERTSEDIQTIKGGRARGRAGVDILGVFSAIVTIAQSFHLTFVQCGDILGARRQRAARSSHNTYYANQNVRQNAESV